MEERILFSSESVLYEDSTNNTFYYSFYVPGGCKRILIDFSYSPDEMEKGDLRKEKVKACLNKYMPPPYDKELLALVWAGADFSDFPLHNLITVSIDNEKGEYIGCAHRHQSHQVHEISRDRASYGFQPDPINEGLWRIAVQCHAVVTPSVEVKTIIKGEF